MCALFCNWLERTSYRYQSHVSERRERSHEVVALDVAGSHEVVDRQVVLMLLSQVRQERKKKPTDTAGACVVEYGNPSHARHPLRTADR